MSWLLIFLGIMFIYVAFWETLGIILGAICIVSGILLDNYEEFEIRAKGEQGGSGRPVDAGRSVQARKPEPPKWW